MAHDVDEAGLEELALATKGFSGAEVAAVCREAALLAMRENSDAEMIKHAHFVEVGGGKEVVSLASEGQCALTLSCIIMFLCISHFSSRLVAQKSRSGCFAQFYGWVRNGRRCFCEMRCLRIFCCCTHGGEDSPNAQSSCRLPSAYRRRSRPTSCSFMQTLREGLAWNQYEPISPSRESHRNLIS